MARPKLAEGLQRNKMVSIYMTQTEFEIANDFAKKQMGLPLALVVRIALLDYIQKKVNSNE